MQALPNDHWRAFVQFFINTGGRSATECAMMAGFSDRSRNSLEVQGHVLVHDARIQAAIQEQSRSALLGLAPLAVGAMRGVLENSGHKDHIRAALGVLDRTGLHAVSETKMTSTVTIERKEQITQTIQLCAELGLDAKALLSKMGVMIDADFNVVSDQEALPAPYNADEDEDLYTGGAP